MNDNELIGQVWGEMRELAEGDEALLADLRIAGEYLGERWQDEEQRRVLVSCANDVMNGRPLNEFFWGVCTWYETPQGHRWWYNLESAVKDKVRE